MAETVHPTVGEAAQILIKAKGQEFLPGITKLLRDLLPATKERKAEMCWVLCDCLWQYDSFKTWAQNNGIPVRSPKNPMRNEDGLVARGMAVVNRLQEEHKA